MNVRKCKRSDFNGYLRKCRIVKVLTTSLYDDDGTIINMFQTKDSYPTKKGLDDEEEETLTKYGLEEIEKRKIINELYTDGQPMDHKLL